MPRRREPYPVALTGGAYQSDDVIADLQRCINLYPESALSPQAPVPVTHYPTPGLVLLSTAPNGSGYRCLYAATNGDVYAVCGKTVYYVDVTWTFTELGTITDLFTPVSMSDNGTEICIVDGTVNGYAIDMVTRAFSQIVDPAFYGSTRVDYVDGFFIFNEPGTRNFYISLFNSLVFDPLDIVVKTGGSDPVQAIICLRREAWVLGTQTSEVWYNAGQADFALSAIPGGFLQHGCVAPYSICRLGEKIFWLHQDANGYGTIAMTENYSAGKISTYAIDSEIQKYLVVSDAIGFAYQIKGHAFYQLTFPQADKTWVFDLATLQWHERLSIDQNGILHRHRTSSACFGYGKNIAGDFQNGSLYVQDPDTFTENGVAISRIRTFPHIVVKGLPVEYLSFALDIEVGTLPSGDGDESFISLRWSDTKGASWGNAVLQSLGLAGEYYTQPSWNNLGMARDRVFEISWSVAAKIALNAAYITAEPNE